MYTHNVVRFVATPLFVSSRESRSQHYSVPVLCWPKADDK